MTLLLDTAIATGGTNKCCPQALRAWTHRQPDLKVPDGDEFICPGCSTPLHLTDGVWTWRPGSGS